LLQSAKIQSDNWIAGAGDKFTTIPFTNFSITVWGRSVIPGPTGPDPTDKNSGSHRVGGWLGTGFQAFFASAVGGTAAAVADGKNGAYFGRGSQTIFNSGMMQFGWNWVGPTKTERDVIRLGIGPAPWNILVEHFNFWFPKVP